MEEGVKPHSQQEEGVGDVLWLGGAPANRGSCFHIFQILNTALSALTEKKTGLLGL